MATARLPFQFGEALAPERIVDREIEVADVSRALQFGERLFVIGPRRFGKTTILRAAVAQAQAAGTPVLMVNAEAYQQLDELAGALITQATAIERGTPEGIARRIGRFFSLLRPELSYDVVTNAWTATIAPVREGPQVPSITMTLDLLNKMAGEMGQRIGIVIDEFQTLSQAEGLAAERQLRAVVQMHDHLSYVFAGSDTTMMLRMVSEHHRPFYRLGRNLFIGPVPRPDFRAFLKDGFRPVSQAIEESGLDRLLDLARDVPYSVQQLALECWTLARATSPLPTIDVAFINAGFAQLLAHQEVGYRALYNSLSTQQQRTAKVLAEAEPKQDITQTQLAHQARQPLSTFRTAREGLLAKSLLRADLYAEGAAAKALVFEDPFLAAWLRAAIN